VVRGVSGLRQIPRDVVFLTVENCIGSIAQNLINELVTESPSDVGGSPEQVDWDTTLEYSVGTWYNTRTGGNEDRAAEHGSNPKDTVCGKTTDPEFGRGL